MADMTVGQTQREIEAMLEIAKIIDSFDIDTRTRILLWLASRQRDRIDEHYRNQLAAIDKCHHSADAKLEAQESRA